MAATFRPKGSFSGFTNSSYNTKTEFFNCHVFLFDLEKMNKKKGIFFLKKNFFFKKKQQKF